MPRPSFPRQALLVAAAVAAFAIPVAGYLLIRSGPTPPLMRADE